MREFASGQWFSGGHSMSEVKHLTVLPHSGSGGKVEQLKQEFQKERDAASSDPTADPVSQPNSALGALDSSISAATAQTDLPSASPASSAPGPRPFDVRQKLVEGKVIAMLQTVFDPEIPINIYELGLIYSIEVDPSTYAVHVRMTLTAPGCPVAGSLPGEVETKIETIPEVPSAKVELVWEPAWTKDRMSEAAMLELGFM
jgi:FeS assembly SUF system protein